MMWTPIFGPGAKVVNEACSLTIRDDGPKSHLVKAGTPTMGGSLILLCLVVPTLLWSDLRNPLVWLSLGVTVDYGAIGFLDDALKLRFKSSRGLPGRLKLLGQFAVGVTAVAILVYGDVLPEDLRLRLSLPFFNFYRHPIQLPAWAYLIFGLLVIVGSSNAVNLTDGLDGLAIGPVIISAGTFLILCYAAGTVLDDFHIARYLNIPHIAGAAELAVYCGAMVGAGVGFLWYNTYPASVFMGDV